MEERSQHRNRKLALARLVQKIDGLNAERLKQAQLERGNPVRVFQHR
ncbi:MAG TPA: hypothetical protein VE621_04150 [Bryobacteraceae bacterium]|nr:hypothetical protein [Bryobacteraceae bacterium]